MPRLPQIRSRYPVPSMGRESLAAPARLAAAEAGTARAVGAVGFAALEGMRLLMQREDEERIKDAIVEYETRRGEIVAEMERKRFYAAGEVPDELGVSKRKAVTDDFGRVRQVERNDIPAEEVAVGLYDMRMKGVVDSISANLANDRQRELFAEHADIQTVRSRNHMLQRTTGFMRERMRDHAMARVDALTNAGQWDAAIEALAETPPEILGEQDRAKKEHQIQELRVTQPIYQAIVNDDELELERRLSDLTDPEVAMPGITPQRRAILTSQVKASIAGIERERKAAQAKGQASNFHRMMVGLTEGDKTVNLDSIHEAHKNGLVNDSQWSQLVRTWYSKAQAGVEADEVALRGEFLMSNGLAVAPEDFLGKKAFDRADEGMQQSVQDGTVLPAVYAHWLGEVAAKHKYIPSGARNSIAQMAMSDDPAELSRAATVWNALKARDPSTLAYAFRGEGYDSIRAQIELVNAGVTPASAKQQVRDAASLTDERHSDFQKGFLRDYPPADFDVNDLIDETPGWESGLFQINPDVRQALSVNVHRRAKELSSLFGGNNEAALKAAWDEARGQWGLQTVDGGADRVTMVPVDQVTGEGMSDLIKLDLNRQLSAFVDRDLTHEDVYLEADPVTELQHKNRQPISWRVIVKDDNTVLERPDGTMYRYRPDLERTVEAHQLQKASDEERERLAQRALRAVDEMPEAGAMAGFGAQP